MQKETTAKYANAQANELAELFSKIAALETANKNPLDIADKDAFYSTKPADIRCSPSIEDFIAKNPTHSVPLQQFVKENRFEEYTTSLRVSSSDLIKAWGDKKFPKQTVSELEAELFDPHYTDRFVVVNMGEKMGHGLFLAHDAKPIKMGELVVCYSGSLSENETPLFSDYSITVDPSFKHEYHSVLINPNNLPSIDSAKVGNLSRFVQHAPDQMQMHKQLIDKDHMADKVATANLQIRVVIYQGFPVLCLQAFRDILPGEILSFSYGQEYFNLRGGCNVFNDFGQTIGTIDKNTLSPTNKAVIDTSPKAKRLDQVKAKNIFFQPFNHEMKIDFNQQFSLCVTHSLSTAISMVSNTEQREFLIKTAAVFKGADTSEKKYQVLSEQLKSTLLKSQLPYLRNILMSHCLNFHAGHKASKAMENSEDTSIKKKI